jgi:FkbM family methyltransferase
VFDSAHTLFAATASEDGLMADVGANVGLFTLQLCHRFDGGVLFEASPEAARKAAENVTRNRLDGFSVQATAIGDAEGHIRFLAERGTGLTSRILAADEPASGPVEEVPVTTLDRALPDHAKRRLSFLKIDVEGAKAQVFAGARETLAVAPALLILFERLKRTPLEPLTALLAEAGYIVFALSDGAPSRDEMHIRRAHDLFACRAERFDAVVRKTADAQA